MMDNIVNDKPYKCLVEGCNAAFKTRFKLKLHDRQHTGDRPFICDIDDCSKSYTQGSHLRRHKSTVHESVTLGELMCEVKGCGMIVRKQNITKHFNRVHNNEPFHCLECDAKFKKKRLLHQHALIHTGETPFKCESCNICFGSITKYKKHKSNHKTYTCDCGKILDRWSRFLDHRKNACTIQRIDHKCVICNKTFTTSTNLKVHSLSHIEDSLREVYKCQYLNCTRSYKYKKNLDAHIREFHEKRKPLLKINCTFPDCTQILRSKKNLKQHLRNIHNGLPKFSKEKVSRKDKGTFKKMMAETLAGINLKFRKRYWSYNSDQSQYENLAVTKIIESNECLKHNSAQKEIIHSTSTLSSEEQSTENKMESNNDEHGEVVVTNEIGGDPSTITEERSNILCLEKVLVDTVKSNLRSSNENTSLLERPESFRFEIKTRDIRDDLRYIRTSSKEA